MMGLVGAGQREMFPGDCRSCSPSVPFSGLPRLQRPFELVPREVLPDGQL